MKDLLGPKSTFLPVVRMEGKSGLRQKDGDWSIKFVLSILPLGESELDSFHA